MAMICLLTLISPETSKACYLYGGCYEIWEISCPCEYSPLFECEEEGGWVSGIFNTSTGTTWYIHNGAPVGTDTVGCVTQNHECSCYYDWQCDGTNFYTRIVQRYTEKPIAYGEYCYVS